MGLRRTLLRALKLNKAVVPAASVKVKLDDGAVGLITKTENTSEGSVVFSVARP